MLHPHDPEFRACVRGLILRKARRLVRLAALRPQDQEDFAQAMEMEFERRRPAYDPKRGAPEAFATTVVNRCSQNYVRDKFCKKRHDPDCRPVHRSGARGAKRPVEARIGSRRLTPEEHRDLQIDLDLVMEKLPPRLQEVVLLLLEEPSISAVARKLDTPRMSFYVTISDLRRRFEREGLKKYL